MSFKKKIAGVIILLIVIVCTLFFIIPRGQRKADSPDKETTPSILIKKPVQDISMPEVIFANDSFNDYCRSTLIPIIREIGYNPLKDFVKITISRVREFYHIKVVILTGCPILSDDLPDGYIEALYLVDDNYIKVEAPEDCPFIIVKENEIHIKHDENFNFIIADLPEWDFYMENDTLKFIKVDFIEPTEVYDGKIMDFETGRLVEQHSTENNTESIQTLPQNKQGPLLTLSMPVAEITDKNLKQFCIDNLLPYLKKFPFNPIEKVIKMIIKKTEDGYNVNIAIDQFIYQREENKCNNPISAFYRIEDYPILIETYKNCDLVEVKEDSITMVNYLLYSIGQTPNWHYWRFHLHNGSMELLEHEGEYPVEPSDLWEFDEETDILGL